MGTGTQWLLVGVKGGREGRGEGEWLMGEGNPHPQLTFAREAGSGGGHWPVCHEGRVL